MSFLTQPFFTELEKANKILLAGAGGGFDIFCGLPLYFGLRKAGKQVYLANLSFSHLASSTAQRLTPAMVEVTPATQGDLYYFPEIYLSQWFDKVQGQQVSIYCFERTGAAPLLAAYRHLVKELNLDAVILVDGGTDSLMRGDETGLGTPEEDIASIAAVAQLNEVPVKLLVCLGFGIDTYHGVCHAQFLEAVADLTRRGGFLGCWSLTQDMDEVQLYRSATESVLKIMHRHPSIVSTSILSAIEGQFGDYHANPRTAGSKLFINPLMSLYWAFQLDPVAGRILYLDKMRKTKNYGQVRQVIENFRDSLPTIKRWEDLPM